MEVQMGLGFIQNKAKEQKGEAGKLLSY